VLVDVTDLPPSKMGAKSLFHFFPPASFGSYVDVYWCNVISSRTTQLGYATHCAYRYVLGVV